MVIIKPEEIRAVRKSMGLTQAAFAVRLGYSNNAHYVNMIECGKSPITAKFQNKVFEMLSEKDSIEAAPINEAAKKFISSFL